MNRGQPYNRISPMKKDPTKKPMISVKTIAARLMDTPKGVPRMGKK